MPGKIGRLHLVQEGEKATGKLIYAGCDHEFEDRSQNGKPCLDDVSVRSAFIICGIFYSSIILFLPERTNLFFGLSASFVCWNCGLWRFYSSFLFLVIVVV